MKIFLTIFIAFIVLFLNIDVHAKKFSKGTKDVHITEKTKKLYDRTLDPKNNPRTKLHFIKVAIHGFLDQLQLPERVIEEKLQGASTGDLMNAMKLMKNVNKGAVDVKELDEMKKYLNYEEISERLKTKKYLNHALLYMKKFFRN
jgi:hypothetical protein